MNSVFPRIAAVGVLFAVGCAEIPETYHPQTVGALSSAQTNNGLCVQLVSPTEILSLGKPVVFDVIVRNTGDHAYWIPQKPQQIFFWTYPNGRHDCFMIEREQTRFFRKDECALLQPGQQITLQSLVETFYFDRPGITEFKVEIDVARNTNPELMPFWSGRAISNSFGMQLVPGSKIKGPLP